MKGRKENIEQGFKTESVTRSLDTQVFLCC